MTDEQAMMAFEDEHARSVAEDGTDYERGYAAGERAGRAAERAALKVEIESLTARLRAVRAEPRKALSCDSDHSGAFGCGNRSCARCFGHG